MPLVALRKIGRLFSTALKTLILKCWYGAAVFRNQASFEIFTSPICNKTKGIVYSSKPLVYNGSIIKDFYLE